MSNLPVLVACRHLEENLEAAKQKIDAHFNEGKRTLAIELYSLEHQSPFFGELKKYAERKGMKIVPIDSPHGSKLTDKLIDSIAFSEDFTQKVPRAAKRLIPAIKKAHRNIYVLAWTRTQIMIKKLKRLLKTDPTPLIMVGVGHDSMIRKEIPVKFETIGSGSLLENWKVRYAGWRREKEKQKKIEQRRKQAQYRRK